MKWTDLYQWGKEKVTGKTLHYDVDNIVTHDPHVFTLTNHIFKAVIYIASPYTLGDKQTNVDKQRSVAHALLDFGYCPVAPLLSHYLEEMRPRPWHEWIQMDFELIRRCDALLRLPGESKGADMEVALARQLGMPVFYSINEMLEVGYATHQNPS